LSIRFETFQKASYIRSFLISHVCTNVKQEMIKLTYLKQSLAICRKIGEKFGEGTTLNNIGLIYNEWGDNAMALQYYEQSLMISRENRQKPQEATTLNNIAVIYKMRGDSEKLLGTLKMSDSFSVPSIINRNQQSLSIGVAA